MRPSLLTRLTLLLAAVAVPAGALAAQQPRERDRTPFERPRPLVVITSPSNRQTITELQAILTARGFVTTAVEWDRGEVAATRRDAPGSPASDRVLLWLERDPTQSDRAHVYLLYGRFEQFLGSTEGPVRVRMNWPAELARQNALQDSIIAFAVARR